MKKILALVALAACAASASAQTYGEVGYVFNTAKDTLPGPVGIQATPGSVRGIFGYGINSNLAVEGMFGVGMGSANVKADGVEVPVTAKIKSGYGIYLKPKFNVNNELEVFGRIGYGSVRISATDDEGTTADTYKGISYGIGVAYNINKTTYIAADYMQYVKDGTFKHTGTAIAVGFKF